MRFFAALFLGFMPLPALALSCLAPTVERSFTQFQASDDIYVIVKGQLTLDTTLLPKGMTLDANPPEMTHVPARLSGMSMGPNGFVRPFDRDITLEVLCLGPWCGGVAPDIETLTFLRKVDDGYALTISPCGGSAFPEPTVAQEDALQKCWRDGTCQ